MLKRQLSKKGFEGAEGTPKGAQGVQLVVSQRIRGLLEFLRRGGWLPLLIEGVKADLYFIFIS